MKTTDTKRVQPQKKAPPKPLSLKIRSGAVSLERRIAPEGEDQLLRG